MDEKERNEFDRVRPYFIGSNQKTTGSSEFADCKGYVETIVTFTLTIFLPAYLCQEFIRIKDPLINWIVSLNI